VSKESVEVDQQQQALESSEVEHRLKDKQQLIIEDYKENQHEHQHDITGDERQPQQQQQYTRDLPANQVSISSTFYARIFPTKFGCQKLQSFETLWRQIIGKKVCKKR